MDRDLILLNRRTTSRRRTTRGSPRSWGAPSGWNTRPVEIAATDYHTAGEPFRIVAEGSVEIPGESVLGRREYASSSDAVERVRRLLCHEPRGHADMYGGFIVPPDDAGADFGVLFWHKDGYSTACGHGTIALGAWAVESGRVEAPPDGEVDVRIDVPPDGSWRGCRAAPAPWSGSHSGTSRRLCIARGVPAGDVRVDVAYGGAIYAFVAAADLGLPLSADALPELIRAGREIKAALEGTDVAVHPDDPRLSGIYGTVIHEQLGPGTTATSSSSPTARSTAPLPARRLRPHRAARGRRRPRRRRELAQRLDHRHVLPCVPARPRRRRRAHRGRGHRVPDGRAPLRPGSTRRPRHRVRPALVAGEASKRRANRAGRLDPHEVPCALDHLDPGARNPLGSVRRGGDRHRAP